MLLSGCSDSKKLDEIKSETGELPFYVEVTDTANGNTEKSPTQHLPVDMLNAFINKIEKGASTSLADPHIFVSDLAMNSVGDTMALSSQYNALSGGLGIVEIYQQNAEKVWAPTATITGGSVFFGVQVALSTAGNVLAVGNTDGHGDVRIYTLLDDATWSERHELDPGTDVSTSDKSGGVTAATDIALSRDGASLVIGNETDASNAVGYNGTATAAQLKDPCTCTRGKIRR